jgi:hypothetical protein
MIEPHRIRYQLTSSMLLGVVVLVACLAMAIAVRQASSAAFGPIRDKPEVRGCTIVRDVVTGQEVRTGC